MPARAISTARRKIRSSARRKRRLPTQMNDANTGNMTRACHSVSTAIASLRISSASTAAAVSEMTLLKAARWAWRSPGELRM